MRLRTAQPSAQPTATAATTATNLQVEPTDDGLGERSFDAGRMPRTGSGCVDSLAALRGHHGHIYGRS